MKKKIILGSYELHYSELEGSIEDVAHKLEKIELSLKEKFDQVGPVRLEFDIGYDSFNIVLFFDRAETDDEYKARLAVSKKHRDLKKKQALANEEAEYKLFEKLKKKYG